VRGARARPRAHATRRGRACKGKGMVCAQSCCRARRLAKSLPERQKNIRANQGIERTQDSADRRHDCRSFSARASRAGRSCNTGYTAAASAGGMHAWRKQARSGKGRWVCQRRFTNDIGMARHAAPASMYANGVGQGRRHKHSMCTRQLHCVPPRASHTPTRQGSTSTRVSHAN